MVGVGMRSVFRRRWLPMKRFLGFFVLALLTTGLYFAYRWAEPKPTSAPRIRSGTGSTVTLTLKNTPFFGYSEGRVTWTLQAGRIELLPLQGGGLANVSTATLTNIRQGALYELPSVVSLPTIVKPASLSSNIPSTVADAKAMAGKPVATFCADEGKYTAGANEALPGDLAVYFFPQWQFRLSGNVQFQSASGDTLTADSLVIVEMRSKQTQKLERRILCETGGKIKAQKAEFQANTARYDPQSRTVECVNGVRGTFKGGSIQTDRLFWSLKEQIVTCPDTTTGTLREVPFIAENLRINIKAETSEARHIQFQLRTDKGLASPFGE